MTGFGQTRQSTRGAPGRRTLRFTGRRVATQGRSGPSAVLWPAKPVSGNVRPHVGRSGPDAPRAAGSTTPVNEGLAILRRGVTMCDRLE
jgi:hypothetical protein